MSAPIPARIQLSLEGQNAVIADLKRVEQQFARSASQMKTLMGGITIGAVAGKLVSVQREFDILNSALITVTGSSQAAAREMKWITQFAKETPFGLAQATQAFVKMKSLGLDPSQAALTSYGNTASAMGKSLNQMIEAVADAATGQFTRLREFGIKASKQGEQIEFTFQGVTTKVGNNAREIEQYLQQIGNVKFGDAMAQRAKTLDGAISALGDSWDGLFLKISQSGIGAAMIGAVETADKALTWLAENIEDVGAAMLTGSVATGAVLFVSNLGLIASTVTAAAASLVGLLAAMGPLAWAATAVVGLTAAYITFKEEIEGTGESAMRMSNMVSVAFDMIRSESEQTAQAVAQSAQSNAQAQGKAAQATVGYWEKTLRWIAGVLDMLANVTLGASDAIERSFIVVAHRIYNTFVDAFNGVAAIAEKTLKLLADKYNALPFLPGRIQPVQFGRLERAADYSLSASAAAGWSEHQDSTAWSDLADRYIKAVQAKNATDDLGKSAKNAADELNKLGQQGQDAGAKAARGMKQARDAAQELFDRLMAKNAGITPTYYADIARLQSLLDAGRISADEYRQALQALTEEQPHVQEAARKAAQAERDLQKQRQEQEQTLQRQIEGLAELLDNLEFETQLIGKNAHQREVATRLREIERLGIERGTEAWRQYAAAIEDVTRRKVQAQDKEKRQKKLQDEWKKTADQINQSLTDALMRGFESGKGFARNLRDTLKNLFGTLVLRPLIQPIVGGIGGFFATGLGSTAASAAGGAGGGLGQLGLLGRAGSMFGNWFGGGTTLGNAWNMFNNGWTLFSRGGYSALGSNLSALWGNGAYGHALSTGAGALAGGLGALMGGRALGRALSGGYAAWGSGNGASNLGAALGLLGGPLGSLLGGALGGVFNRLFGRKLKDFGIEGEFGGEAGFTGRQWRHYKGGAFRSSKTTYSALDEEARQALAQPFNAMRQQMREYVDLLGLPVQALTAINSFTHTFRLNLQGLSEDKIAERYAAALGEVKERMAQTLLDAMAASLKPEAINWDGDFLVKEAAAAAQESREQFRYFFQRDGETAVQTLERMAASLGAVNSAFGLLGRTLLQTSVHGADMASRIIEQFGQGEQGRNAFNSAAQTYLQNFYTEQERRANALNVLSREFQRLGLAMPSTRAQFRALVDGLDLSTDAGRRMFAQLLSLSGAFAEATDGMDDASDSAKKLADKLKEALDAAKDATDTALKALEDAIDRQISAFRSALESVKSLAAEAKEIRDLAWGGSRELYSASPAVSANLAAQGNQYIAQSLLSIRHGLMPDASKLRDAISAAKGGLVEGNYTSFVDYERDRLVLAGRLQEIGDRADGQLSVAEQQVKHLETQIAQLNQQKEYWREQVALMRGQITHVSSIDEGVSKLVAAMEAERRARAAVDAANKKPGAGAGGATFGGSAPAGGAVNGRAAAEAALQQIGKDGGRAQVYHGPGGWHVRRITDEAELDNANKLARSIVNAHGDRKAFTDAVAGKSVLEIAGAMGYMADDTQRFLESQGYKVQGGRVVPAYARGGYHGGGWALVGEQGPELVNFEQPARIYNHADTRAALSGSDGEAAREVAALRREVAELRAVLASIADNTRRSADTLRNVTPDGDALRVETV